MARMNHLIFITGQPGCGKTTLGSELAALMRRDWDFALHIDHDHLEAIRSVERRLKAIREKYKEELPVTYVSEAETVCKTSRQVFLDSLESLILNNLQQGVGVVVTANLLDGDSHMLNSLIARARACAAYPVGIQIVHVKSDPNPNPDENENIRRLRARGLAVDELDWLQPKNLPNFLKRLEKFSMVTSFGERTHHVLEMWDKADAEKVVTKLWGDIRATEGIKVEPDPAAEFKPYGNPDQQFLDKTSLRKGRLMELGH